MEYRLTTSDTQGFIPVRDRLFVPPAESHKGQNGRLLVIGGSQLFHAAVLWSAEIASHFVDMVHFASTEENNAIFAALKETFRNGIVVRREAIPEYAAEDDCILMGPGMVRTEQPAGDIPDGYDEILRIRDEGVFTRALTRYATRHFAGKRLVLDAGALQMLDPAWLHELKEKPVITPHQLEFERVFGVDVRDMEFERKVETVRQFAERYSCVILLKAITDIASDGNDVYVIEGGNQGLTKGGSGDVLSGLIAAFATKTDPLVSAVAGSFLLKKAADELSETSGYWYNMDNLINRIPETLKRMM
jgi:NAD(P)H-hydrate epimerase